MIFGKNCPSESFPLPGFIERCYFWISFLIIISIKLLLLFLLMLFTIWWLLSSWYHYITSDVITFLFNQRAFNPSCSLASLVVMMLALTNWVNLSARLLLSALNRLPSFNLT